MKLFDLSVAETPTVPSRMQPWIGPGLSLGLAILLLLLNRQYKDPIPNPNLIFGLILVFSSYMGGLASGLVAAIIAIAFTVYAWAIPGHPLTYSPENLRRLIVSLVCMPAMALLAGLLKARADLQHRALANYLALEKKRNHALVVALSGAEPVEGYLPVCAWCHKTREKDGNWISLESYLVKKSGTHITHGICPDCRPAFSEGIRKESGNQ